MSEITSFNITFIDKIELIFALNVENFFGVQTADKSLIYQIFPSKIIELKLSINKVLSFIKLFLEFS